MSNSKVLMQHLKGYAEKVGIKLTPLRESILALLQSSEHPLTAYDLLRELRKKSPNAEPPTVYRVLDLFQQKGLLHRIESNNTYILCIHPDTSHSSHLLICKNCGDTLEIDNKNLLAAIKKSIKNSGFKLSEDLIEIRGFCSKCQHKQINI